MEVLQVFLQGFVPDSNKVTIRSVAISKTDFFILDIFGFDFQPIPLSENSLKSKALYDLPVQQT